MFGTVYLLVCLFFGVQLLRLLIPDVRRLYVGISSKQETIAKVPSLLFLIPAGFIVGTLTVTAATYYIALAIHSFIPKEMHVLYPANIVSLCIFAYLGSFFWQKCYARNRKLGEEAKANARFNVDSKKISLPRFNRSPLSIVLFAMTVLGIIGTAAYICFYTFNIKNGLLNVGPTVASDFAPHIAITSSFSQGSNFPTEYPHFPGDNIQYHFFFYFLCGNLNVLGLPLDWAINLPSILVMVCAIVLLGTLAVLISGRRLAFLITPFLVFFRSALNIVYQMKELLSVPGASLSSAISDISNQSVWYNLIPRDDWGLWAINVYANQRHLMLGVSVMLIMIFLFIPHVRRMFLHLSKAIGFKAKMKQFFASREAWLPRRNDPLRPYSLAAVAALIVITVPFFHGAALIATLIVLFGMALFSENRLTYAVIAILATASSIGQALLLSGDVGNVVSLRQIFGFIVDKPTFLSIAEYLLKMAGLAIVIPALLFVGLLIFETVKKKNKYRAFLILAFALPLVFAFFAQVSREMLANHKFIQFSLLLFDVFIAGFLSYLFCLPLRFRRNRREALSGESAASAPALVSPAVYVISQIRSALLATVIVVLMLGTGVSEWFTFRNLNEEKIGLRVNSEMVEWIEQNTSGKAVFLTKDWYINTFFLSGRMSYYGWPYYAWSAGHDTDLRLQTYEYLLSGCGGNLEIFRATCAAENIEYFLFDPELYSYRNGAGEYIFNGEFFLENLTPLATFPNDNNAVIFSVAN